MKTIATVIITMGITLTAILITHISMSHELELECTDANGVALTDKKGRMICIDRGSVVEFFGIN